MMSSWAGSNLEDNIWNHDDPLNPPPPDRSSNPTVNWHKQKRSNDTHQSLADPAARFYKKSSGSEAKLGYLGHVITENRNGLIVDTRLTLATGLAERSAALEMAANKEAGKRITLGADSRLRYAELCGTDAGAGHYTARGAERHQPGQRNRWAHDLPPRLCGQSAKTETGGGSLRMDQDGGFAA